MLGYFPRPYPDELLYSVIARYAVHSGICSSKELVEELFLSRNAAAVVDFPGHLSTFVNQIAHLHPYTVDDWIQHHTLYPAYLPFVPSERAYQIIQSAKSNNANDIHTRMGVAAATISTPKYLRICKQCYIEQQWRYGESYWQRTFQLPGVVVCPIHSQPLSITDVLYHPNSKFSFVPARQFNIIAQLDSPEIRRSISHLTHLANSFYDLLNSPTDIHFTFQQLSQFYFQLAKNHGLTKGSRVLHGDVVEKLMTYWPRDLLFRLDSTLSPPISWVTLLFRKHRKFSHPLQHLLIWQCFDKRNAADVISLINSSPIAKAVKPVVKKSDISGERLEHERQVWLLICGEHKARGVKWIRTEGGGDANYMWLYRNDREWLIANTPEKVKSTILNRVDWHERDQQTLEALKQLKKKFSGMDLNTRMTKAWFIKNTEMKATLEKNLNKLPACKDFIDSHSETVEQFQRRRIVAAVAELQTTHADIPAWKIIRKAGIRKQFVNNDLLAFINIVKGTAIGTDTSEIFTNSR